MIEKLDEYQEEAIKTMKPMSLSDSNKYMCIKIAEETGEICQLISKFEFHGKPFTQEDIKNELSDLSWYIANLAHSHGIKLSEVATYNIEKLRKRHGEKYNAEFYKK